jgi:hypothetical protein
MVWLWISWDESTWEHGKHQTLSLATLLTSWAHRFKEERRVGGCNDGPSKRSPTESCELCDGTEALLPPLPTPPPDPVVAIYGLYAIFWGDPPVSFPGYWPTPDALSDIIRLSAVTTTYSRSNVSIESTNAPVKKVYTTFRAGIAFRQHRPPKQRCDSPPSISHTREV